MKKLKVFMLLILGVICLLLAPSNVYASTYDDIQSEVSNLVNQGKLPTYHNYYSQMTGYQTYYMKMYKTSSSESTKEYFASMSQSELYSIIKWYENSWDSTWYDVLTNLDIEPQYLDQDRILGLYYDSDATENASYLYLFWTSRYIPSEFMTISEITVNGKTYKQYPTNDLFEPEWYQSDYYHFKDYDLTIHKTPIAGFENGCEFGIPLTKKYKFTNIKTCVNKLEYDKDPDPTNKYSASIDTDATFDLGLYPKYQGKSVCQLVTHAYELIKDCEVQSYYDWGFGGYIHLVHFNTSIPIDKIYRVDVSYILSSDNKEWYDWWVADKEYRVIKSMTPDKKSTGIFGLYDTYGFKEGIFKSNEKNSITYKYEMMLNYDEQNWDLFCDTDIESDYTRIKDFKILRLNYLVDNKVYDVAVKMDSIDGETKNILDRDLILNTESNLWKGKDILYGIADGIKSIGSIIQIVVAVTVFLLIFYVGYKLVIMIKEALKNDS